MSKNPECRLEDVRFDEQGLIPAIVQDAGTREVLTLAYMNEESLRRTLEEGETWFWSRSRAQLWHKGETSSNTQHVRRVVADCDRDALMVLVEPQGPACHTGARSCFHHELNDNGTKAELVDEAGSREVGPLLEGLYALIEDRRREMPEGSYTTYLFKEGLDKILKKVGEEAAETIIAAKNDEPHRIVSEISDLVYHLLVLMVERGVKLEDVAAELAKRGGAREGKG